jgi:hypothetical protein
MVTRFATRRAVAVVTAISLSGAIVIACTGQVPSNAANAVAALPAKSSTWSDTSHGNDAQPDYATVFPDTKVNEFQISIAPADWQAMLDDMTKIFGPRGSGGMGGGPGGPGPGVGPNGGARPDRMAMGSDRGAFPMAPGSDWAGGPVPPDGEGGGRGGMLGPSEQPMWVAATVTFNGRTWNKVGVRFKGNSSLRSAWQSGSDKIPFKLDFEQWEKDFPEIKNQRFYGFKQLSLSTNWNDDSGIREAITYDLLADSGLTAANTGFYEVSLDHGNGKASLGLYTAIEVIDDTVIKRTFNGDKGNIYEAEGQAASLAEGTLTGIPSSFQKENNKDGTWSDIEALYAVLHDAQRTTDPAGWRTRLEACFDVPTFLKWLAVSAAIQHWDTYGGMSHNYYLYNDPANGRLTWISWDHNLVLGAMGGGMPQPPVGGAGMPQPPGGGAGMPQPPNGVAFPPQGAAGRMGPGGGRNTSLDKKDVAANWPLIRFLLDDPTYYAAYVRYLGDTVNGPFQVATMQAKVNRYAGLLAPYAAKQANGSPYSTAVQTLNDAIATRVKAVSDFLATQAP